MDTENVIHWHPAFCSVMELEFRANRDAFEYERENEISKFPLRVDLLIIKKKLDEAIENEFGNFFLETNIRWR